MARMSGEFTLVLLGAGLLTAGYFLWPDDDPAKKAEEQVARGNAPAGATRHYYGSHVMLLPGRYSGSGGSPVSSGAAARGGFGSIGRAFSGGG
jgi:hypothetical protein